MEGLKALLNKLLNPSYDQIVGSFNKTIQKLDKLHSNCLIRIAENDEEIERLGAQNALLEDEAEQAALTATKLRDLLG